MKRLLSLLIVLFAVSVAAQTRPNTPPSKSPASQGLETSAATSAIEKKVEAFLHKLYAWGPSFRLKVGPLKDAAVHGFYEVPVEVTVGQQSDSAVVYVSKDGRYLLRGDLQDMSADPLAAVRSLFLTPRPFPAAHPFGLVETLARLLPSARSSPPSSASVPPPTQILAPARPTPLT